ncbi:response regulator transcription factor [Dyadobacter fanqingshengii]|uniref:Response regulator transcription factor n=1 Tax=Dyadobacter fanqingshengii TaxID=2906443 RepID=A0A9X1PDZ5_9BACT|nr:response regulator transcription factor [Dyadobacter fanqingshengii]MCF0041502.1 response regulator transcription factor [Dyadobacter fanqingshengii]USJ36779.1 response regulator transcription factor [Dyadobacter fanqingshengii]
MEIPSLLLIDDEVQYSELTKEYLEMKGCKVMLKHDGQAGLDAFKLHAFDLCVLDIKMPKKDGFTLAEEIKELNETTPIIFLTGQSLKEDKIKGLTLGADDYLTKPFSMEELYLRIRAILKRVKVQEKAIVIDQYQWGHSKFDLELRELTVAGKRIKLTSIESKLLKLFCENQNKVLTRDAAMMGIWGDEEHYRGYSLNVYVSKLRKFLKPDTSVEILNLHGEGYKLVYKQSVAG